jgi:hypothetical protein
MRRIIIAAAATALLAVTAQPAAADTEAFVERCETNSQWRLSNDTAGNLFADWSYDTRTAVEDGCKHLTAVVEDDLDFDVEQSDAEQTSAGRFVLFGPWVPGDTAFAGTASGIGGLSTGPMTITGPLLNATIAYSAPDGTRAVAEHRGLGTCGARCFATRSVWVLTSG